MIKTTKTTYCPKKLITSNYLLTIRRTSKKTFNLLGDLIMSKDAVKV